MKDKLYVVNYALRYLEDDKFKVDKLTYFTEELPTVETAKEMAINFSCDVIINVVGILDVWSDEKQKDNSFYAKFNDKEIEKDEQTGI